MHETDLWCNRTLRYLDAHVGIHGGPGLTRSTAVGGHVLIWVTQHSGVATPIKLHLRTSAYENLVHLSSFFFSVFVLFLFIFLFSFHIFCLFKVLIFFYFFYFLFLSFLFYIKKRVCLCLSRLRSCYVSVDCWHQQNVRFSLPRRASILVCLLLLSLLGCACLSVGLFLATVGPFHDTWRFSCRKKWTWRCSFSSAASSPYCFFYLHLFLVKNLNRSIKKELKNIFVRWYSCIFCNDPFRWLGRVTRICCVLTCSFFISWLLVLRRLYGRVCQHHFLRISNCLIPWASIPALQERNIWNTFIYLLTNKKYKPFI